MVSAKVRGVVAAFFRLNKMSLHTDIKEQISIDGPAAAGKSTVAKSVARILDAYYINTGEMYRAVTWLALQRHIDPECDQATVIRLLDETELRLIKDTTDINRLILYVNNQRVDIANFRTPEVTTKVSFIAKIPKVREWLVKRQKETANLGLIVMEGRDIGTVVFPNARHKFFLTASPEERARRRLAQAGEVVDGATIKSVAADIAERDHIDSTREIAPLRPAEDAIIIDTTCLDSDAASARITKIIKERWDQ